MQLMANPGGYILFLLWVELREKCNEMIYVTIMFIWKAVGGLPQYTVRCFAKVAFP